MSKEHKAETEKHHDALDHGYPLLEHQLIREHP
jgi:hypothetical protein